MHPLENEPPTNSIYLGLAVIQDIWVFEQTLFRNKNRPYVFKKSCPIFKVYSLNENGQDLLDIQKKLKTRVVLGINKS